MRDLRDTKQAIEHHGTMQELNAKAATAKGDHAGAKRAMERAAWAKKGFMLEGNAEMTDPAYSMGNQELRGDAHRHGLIHSDATDPPLA